MWTHLQLEIDRAGPPISHGNIQKKAARASQIFGREFRNPTYLTEPAAVYMEQVNRSIMIKISMRVAEAIRDAARA